MKSKYKSQF